MYSLSFSLAFASSQKFICIPFLSAPFSVLQVGVAGLSDCLGLVSAFLILDYISRCTYIWLNFHVRLDRWKSYLIGRIEHPPIVRHQANAQSVLFIIQHQTAAFFSSPQNYCKYLHV